MDTLTERGNELLRRVWADLQKASHLRELEAIKANPGKHRLTRIMAYGRTTNYRYWPAGETVRKSRKEKTSFCVAVSKNAAGVYLIWRQVDRYKMVRARWRWYEAERYDFQWASTRNEARAIAARKAAKAKEPPKPTGNFGRGIGSVLNDVA